MTPEELLIPRIKVVAEYPAMDCQVGHIITVNNMYPTMFTVPMQAGGEKWQHVVYYEGMLHLFKSLQWWEDRKPEDLPEYLKDREGNVIIATYWHEQGAVYENAAGLKLPDAIPYAICLYMPATKKEYELQHQ